MCQLEARKRHEVNLKCKLGCAWIVDLSRGSRTYCVDHGLVAYFCVDHGLAALNWCFDKSLFKEKQLLVRLKTY